MKGKSSFKWLGMPRGFGRGRRFFFHDRLLLQVYYMKSGTRTLWTREALEPGWYLKGFGRLQSETVGDAMAEAEAIFFQAVNQYKRSK